MGIWSGVLSMCSKSNGKNIIGQLELVWREIIAAKGLSGELAYRIEKLALRLDTIADKIFIKTVKAHDILSECKILTEQFNSELIKPQNTALLILTRMEDRVDDLVKTTHEFRIKAG